MKLSFSTQRWGLSTWTEVLDKAEEMHFDGVEVFSGDFRLTQKDYHELRERNLSLVCIDTGLDISLSELRTENLGLRAKSLICCYASLPNWDIINHNLTALVALARENHQIILIKTCGLYADTGLLRDLLNSFACDELAVEWDVHCPFREKGESPATTIKNLGCYVRHVHLSDSDDTGRFTLIGEGTMPISEVMDALWSIDYDGFISPDWNPAWMPEMSDMDVILPYFANYMERFERNRVTRAKLLPNHDGTGFYVWKRDELIPLTFSQVLDRMAEEFPDQYCFKYTTLDYTRTYAEFRLDVDNFARTLVSMGVGRGSKVAVWATNVPEWFITFWATVKIGAVLVSVNTAYRSHEVEYLLRQSDTHTLVTIDRSLDTSYADIISELCPEIRQSRAGEPLHCKRLPMLRNVITVGYHQQGCLSFDEAMQRSSMVSREQIQALASRVRPDDVCNMQYTSGTTGFPKGVMLTHYNVVNNGKCIGDRMGLSTADRMMIQVPMFHCFGMVLSMTAAVTHGAVMCPMPYFSAKASLACINLERITCFNGVPTMFIAMFNHPDYRKTDFSHMRTGIMAGAGCPPELMRRAAQSDEMNMRGIVSVYGQTESAPGSTMSAWTDDISVRTDTVGYAFPHVECKIIDPDTGEELPAGRNGEFCSRGYNTMKGYYKMPVETTQTVDSDGWLHSGDLAQRDENGNYRITGRLKDMIIRGGENIYPKEIEEFIYTHPKVRDVQVVGVPDEKYGEEALALIILKEGETLSEPEMRSFISASIARHKVPRYIQFTDSFPMNAAGKVQKYKIREQFSKTAL